MFRKYIKLGNYIWRRWDTNLSVLSSTYRSKRTYKSCLQDHLNVAKICANNASMHGVLSLHATVSKTNFKLLLLMSWWHFSTFRVMIHFGHNLHNSVFYEVIICYEMSYLRWNILDLNFVYMVMLVILCWLNHNAYKTVAYEH